MHPVPILFGISCAAACWFAAQSRDPDVRLIAIYLAIEWALANAAWYADMLVVMPVFDFWCGVIALVFWWTRKDTWIALIVHLVAIRLVLHILDYLTGHAFLVPYIHALNATFALMLVTVAWPGGRNARDTLRNSFRRCVRILSAKAPGGVNRDGG